MSTTAPSDDAVLRFDEGIPGFPDLRRFQLIELVGGGAFQLLQSLDDESMSMIVCSPWVFFPDYALEIGDSDEEALDIHRAEDAIVFCPVTVEAPDKAFVNLLGPFVVNAQTHQGRQIVLVDTEYDVRTALPLEVA